jgi:predicted transcriptional regulator
MHNIFSLSSTRNNQAMPDSMADYLRADMECEGLLECFHGLTDLDRDCFEVIVTDEAPLTIDEIADEVDRERSTVYRSVQRLRQAGFVQKEQVNYDQGGYYHVFSPTDPDVIADDMQQMLNDWYAKMGQLIGEFRTKYDTSDQPAAAAES